MRFSNGIEPNGEPTEMSGSKLRSGVRSIRMRLFDSAAKITSAATWGGRVGILPGSLGGEISQVLAVAHQGRSLMAVVGCAHDTPRRVPLLPSIRSRLMTNRCPVFDPGICARICAYDCLGAVGKARKSLTLLGSAWAQETPPLGQG
jgi:hypothetical protein